MNLTEGTDRILSSLPEVIPSPPSQAGVDEAGPEAKSIQHSRLVSGGTFLFDSREDVPVVWGGDDGQVAWAQGEYLVIVGAAGLGKTTLAQQLTLGRMGLLDTVLGMPVETGKLKTLYVAADRPSQAQRSMRRMVKPSDRGLIDERLVVQRGPLPFDIGQDPQSLLAWLTDQGVDTLVIDSLKDVAVGVAKDEVGAAINVALQLVLAAGIEVLVLHHQRKGAQGEKKPKNLDEVYGSVWIVNGAGSVILLWGQAGDPLVELAHLKQPSETIGPWQIQHDHYLGSSTVLDEIKPIDVLRGAQNGISARAMAVALFKTQEPTPSEVEKARRRLDTLVRVGKADCPDRGTNGGAGGGGTALYYPKNGLLEHP